MFLTEPIETSVTFEGYTFRINPAFDVILDIQKLFKEEELPDVLKVRQALKMLIVNQRNVTKVDGSELLKEIYRCCINTEERPSTRKKPPTFDFEHDGEYIYSSYMLDYGIDLIDMQGKLPWKKFIALFQGLSENTKIREVMRIRNMQIPTFNGRNGEQIREIQELKSYYALPVRGGGGQSGLDSLFSTLERLAVKNG